MSYSSSIKKFLTYTMTGTVIGRGSYSKVYLGYTANNEKCAIKLISSIGLNTSIRDKLLDEANILRRLNHPNIIKLYDIYEDMGDIYIIMEYCENTMLSILDKKLNEIKVKYYIKQLVDGLFYLQKKNIVHRDIKPANILLKNDNIKIADFGFAKALEDNNMMMDTICGSPLYMAPEILYKAKYSSKSDLWSVGVIIYQMIYRKHPYKNPKSIIDLIKKIDYDEIEFDVMVDNEKITEECINLMKELLEISPTNRMTLNELKNDIWFIDVSLPIISITPETSLIQSNHKLDKNVSGINRPVDNSFEYMFNLDESNSGVNKTSYTNELNDTDSLDNDMNGEIIIDNYLENINVKTKPINISPKKPILKSNIKQSTNKEHYKYISNSISINNNDNKSIGNSRDYNNDRNSYSSTSFGSSGIGSAGIGSSFLNLFHKFL